MKPAAGSYASHEILRVYPANLGSPAAATTAAFLYDDRNVYVAIRAFDSDPTSVRAPIVRRDRVLQDQDYVEVFLDPMNTRRSALFFRVSARGILTDGQYDDKTRVRDTHLISTSTRRPRLMTRAGP